MRHRHAITTLAAEQVSSPLEIVYREVDELIPQLKNVRRHPKKQVAQIARSIKAFGFNVPFQVDRNSRLIAGHGRLAACQMLGIRRVPTICLEHLSEAQIRAFAIAENKIAEGARWDRSRLAEELQFLSGINLDFELEITGFEIKEIELLIENLNCPARQDPKPAEQLSKSDSHVAVSCPGDVWLLGSHRLLCGSPWDEQNYALLMNGQRTAAVLTHVPGGRADDAELLRKVFSELAEHSDPAAVQFVVADRHFIRNLGVAERAGLKLVDICVAVKQHADTGAVYQSQHDLIFVFRSIEVDSLSMPQFSRSNVWFYPRTRSVRRPSELRKAEVIQNTLPIRLVADAINDSTESGGMVLDPFLGSGTTLIAAEQTRRICYAIESDPLQVDRVVRHWQELSGKNAVNEKTGLSFDQIGEEHDGRA